MEPREKKRKKPLQWIITALVILIFCVALIITVVRLMEWNQLQREKEALEQEKEDLEQSGDVLE